MATRLSLADSCASCELSWKTGERTNFKYDLATNDGKLSHQSVRDAISKLQVDLNACLTVQVEKDKLKNAQLKNSGVRPHAKPGSARAAGGTDDGAEEDVVTGVAGDDSDDMGLEEDEDDEDQDVPYKAEHVEQTSKREAKDSDSTSNKKPKLLDS